MGNNIKKTFLLFEEKARELYESKFTKELHDSGFKVVFDIKEGVSSIRKGPDYEAIKSFVITFRNFSMDSDLISIRNISKIYEDLDENDELRKKFELARNKLNEFLDSKSKTNFNGVQLTFRKIIDTYIYGDVIHLNKHDEFKNWVNIQAVKDIIFNDIVYFLGRCSNIIYYINSLNNEYLERLGHK